MSSIKVDRNCQLIIASLQGDWYFDLISFELLLHYWLKWVVDIWFMIILEHLKVSKTTKIPVVEKYFTRQDFRLTKPNCWYLFSIFLRRRRWIENIFISINEFLFIVLHFLWYQRMTRRICGGETKRIQICFGPQKNTFWIVNKWNLTAKNKWKNKVGFDNPIQLKGGFWGLFWVH